MDHLAAHHASKERTNEMQLRAIDSEIHDLEFDRSPATKGATTHDISEMNALGLTPTFRRRFKFVAMVGFSSTVVIAWQNALTTFGFGLLNGGTGGLFWTFVFSMIAMTFVYLSLGELASVFPTAGGQYQWVAECAPDRFRRMLAYCTGWLLVLGWQTWLTSCGVAMGNIIKYCILTYHPNSAAVDSQWFPTLLGILALLSGGLFNLYLTKRFPIFESVMLVIHLAAWLAIIVTLWVTSERGDAADVLFTFANGGGWANSGVATLIGCLTAWSSILGYDSSVHMTENASDASWTIPFSLLTAFAVNTALAFVAVVTMIFCVGNVDEVLAQTNYMPFIVIFLNSTRSRAATVVMTVPLLLTAYSALISQVATASRQLWSFSRDGGTPFAAYLAPVHDADVPRRAVWATVLFTSVISCINFGANGIGFQAICSLAVVSVTFSYTVCISTLLGRRFFGRALPKERFSLGAWGPFVNIVALCCTAPVTVLSIFPSYVNPPPLYMNWAVLVFGVVTLFAAAWYAISGRKTFNPPIRKESFGDNG